MSYYAISQNSNNKLYLLLENLMHRSKYIDFVRISREMIIVKGRKNHNKAIL